MVHNMSYKKFLMCLLFVLASSVCLAPTAWAAGESVYLSPSSKSVTQGSTFSIAVRVTTSGANAVQANLTYPTDKLTYLSTSYVGSAFEIQAESTGGSGSIHIGRGTLSTASGDKLVATISFRAAVKSGSGSISFGNGSALVNSGSSLSPSLSGATIQFAAPAPPPPAPVIDTTPPVISNLKANTIQITSAIVSWDTNEPADSAVDYGLDATYGLTISSGEKTTHHQITLSSSFLVPKTTFHFRASSSDASGNKQVDTDHSFQTLGIPYEVSVKDAKGKTIPGAAVSVDGTTLTSNSKGLARFSLGYGPHTVTATYKQANVSKALTLGQKDLSDKSATTTSLTLNAKRLSVSYSGYYIPATLLVGIVLGSTVWRLFPASFIGSGQWHFKKAKISLLQKYYGDASPDHNPYVQNKVSTRLDRLMQLFKRKPRA